eukprot:7318496-Prymnesium_polylepis.1
MVGRAEPRRSAAPAHARVGHTSIYVWGRKKGRYKRQAERPDGGLGWRGGWRIRVAMVVAMIMHGGRPMTGRRRGR